MDTQQGNILQSAQNADRFLTDNAAELGDIVDAGMRKELSDDLVVLAGHTTAQDSHVRQAQSALATRRLKRRSLVRDHMTPIARVAHLKLQGTPELLSLSLPKGRQTVEQLAAKATGMADAATKYQDIFVQAGLKADFIDQLRAAAGAMVAAVSDRISNQGRVRTASEALGTTLLHARKLVAAIDAMLTSTLVSKPELLASWKLMKRIPVARRSSATAAAPSSATKPVAVATPLVTEAASASTQAAVSPPIGTAT